MTGANRGLGLELVRRLLADGHEVWGSARSADAPALSGLGPAGVLTLDLGSEASIDGALAALATQTDGLDVLINNAGIDARALGAPDDDRGPFALSPEVMLEVTRINAVGPMLVTRAARPLLRAGRDPLVVNVSSQLGSMQVAASKGRDTAYCVSKAALNMWTVKSAGALAADGITTVMVHPGWVKTDMGGASAALTPEASASAIVDTIGRLGRGDNGRFLTWDGADHPW